MFLAPPCTGWHNCLTCGKLSTMDIAPILAETVSLRFHLHTSVLLVMSGVGVFFWWAFTQLGPKQVEPGEVVSTRRQRAWIIFGFLITLVLVLRSGR